MTYAERNTIVSLFTGMLVFGIYSYKMYGLFLGGRFEAADAGVLMGKSVMVMIGASMAAMIVMTILFNIVFAIASDEEKPSHLVDERDKLISLKGMQFSFIVFGVGFVGTSIAMIFGIAPLMAIYVLITSMFISSISGDAFKLISYRRGY